MPCLVNKETSMAFCMFQDQSRMMASTQGKEMYLKDIEDLQNSGGMTKD